MAQAVSTIDPFALEVFWSRLIGVVNEQATALVHTSFSPPVAEAGDLSACVFDARGYLLAQAITGTPGHINSMANCIRHFLAEFPPETIKPGDVWITNDPWKTSGHLLDITVITPTFHQGKLVAFFGNICHVADIGGRVFSADARELYEEGLFIPISRLFVEGKPNEDLFRIIQNNIRAPSEVTAELYSMTAANDVGAARLSEFMDEFGFTTIEPLADEIIARSDRAMREAIARLPDGSYENVTMTDGYDEPIRLQVRVDIKGEAVHVDFAGTSPESRYGINVVLNYTEAYATFALKALLAPDVPNNEGSFRSLTVTAPEGCILNCRRPAPVAARHILGHFLPALIFGALADVVPGRIMAEGSANLWNTQFHGFYPDGRRFNLLFFNAGGTGARTGLDGISSTAFPSGISGTAVEIIENRSPLVVLEKALRPDSGGPGQFRGGLGHRLVIAGLRTNRPYTFSPFFDRLQFPARGLHGGQAGAPGDYFLKHPDGTIERPNPKATIYPDPQTELWIELPGGGGLGDPRQRPRERVLNDVREGLVSPERVEKDYGMLNQ
ncbi:MAG TPA: hydantoinase B/oxoprolinase family protein [Chloroflexota bacterium]|nr:hydantoinase B/oxoprolinase family protein [Chloroflexota bacterium]